MFESSDKKQSINFLEPVYSPSDIWANAYIWLVSVGKYLLLFVEILVLGVFASRFVLDKQNNDLTEEINDKVTLLSNDSWQQNAALFENYQILFTDMKKIREGQDTQSTLISELLNGVPSTMEIQTFSVTNGTVTFYLTSTSISSVNDYESALRNNPNYEDVRFSINKEGTNLEVRVSFSINGTE